MAAAREYELVLMLDPGGDEVARDGLAKEAKAQIEAKGALKLEDNWGLRKMAYEIAQRTEADYRWFRFEAPTELLDGLNHSLRIADGVLRFRIFKVDADTPTIAPPATGAPAASRERPAADASQGDGEPEAPQPAAEGEPAEPVAEAEADAEASEHASEPVEPAAEAAPEAAAEAAPEPAEPAAEAAEAAPEPVAEPAEPAAETSPVAAEDPGAEDDGEAAESSE